MAGKPSKSTRYVVLSNVSGNTFAKIGDVEATSAVSAIRQIVSEAGSYVAIPERSFQILPVTVKIPEPQIVIGGEEVPQAPKPAQNSGGAVADAARQMREELEPIDEVPVA